MLISKKIKTAFIHNHRTGGTSITNILLKEHFYMPVQQQHEDMITRHTILKKLYGYFIFGFVRNPWERLASWYCLLHSMDKDQTTKKSFETFLYDLKFDKCFHINQMDYFKDSDGNIRTDFIGTFENLHDDLHEILHTIGIKNYGIKRTNQSLNLNYKDFYNSSCKKFVKKYCEEDIDIFGYKF